LIADNKESTVAEIGGGQGIDLLFIKKELKCHLFKF
jgi:hypothetical protein